MNLQIVFNCFIVFASINIIGIGFLIIFRVSNFINFAHGIIFTMGAYSVLLFSNWLNLSYYFAVPLALILSIISGCLIDGFIYHPLRKRGASSLLLLLASLGIYIVLQNFISLVFGDDTKILGSGIVREGVNVLGAKITTYQLIIIAVSVILIAALWWVMKKTRLGKSMRAVANDPELATVSGIDTDRVILWAFGVGSGLAAVAGLLVALDVGMTPTMGLNALMLAVVAVIIGGVGSITGMAMGAFLLAAAQQFAAWQFGSQWQDALAFAILLVFLLIRPQGFLGRKPKKATL